MSEFLEKIKYDSNQLVDILKDANDENKKEWGAALTERLHSLYDNFINYCEMNKEFECIRIQRKNQSVTEKGPK